MNGHGNAGPQGVSGAQAPDQGAVCLAATADKTKRQSCDLSDRARQFRVYLPGSQAKRWLALPPSQRSRAVAAALGGVKAGIDLGKLIDAAGELRRVGVLLNQAVKLAHMGCAPLEELRNDQAAA